LAAKFSFEMQTGFVQLLWRTEVFWVLPWLLASVIQAVPAIITLTGGAGPIEIAYEMDGGEQITIMARSLADDPIDVVLELSLDNQRMAFNDDHGTDIANLAPLDAAIVDFVPPDAGTYTLRIHSFNGAQTGDVEVTVQSSPLIPPCAEPQHIANLVANGTFACWLELEAGTALTISATDVSGTLDPVLTLLDAEATVLARNDDHGTADLTLNVLDAKIAAYIIPVVVRYVIHVGVFVSGNGVFEIMIEQSSAATP
jgi:hypothetical protein